MQVAFRREAGDDLAIARRYYEDQRPGLGDAFETVVHGILEILKQQPLAFPNVHRDVRRVLLPRFPYAIYYIPRADTIEIVACLHTRRHPRRFGSHEVTPNGRVQLPGLAGFEGSR